MLGLALASRPMGLGSGVFTLLVFFGLSLAFCFVGRHSTSPGKFYGLAIVLPGLVATFLFLAPKEGDLRTSASQEHDDAFYSRLTVYVLTLLGALASVGFVVATHFGRRIVAQRRLAA